VTMEELRAFLTSVLVTPSTRSRNWMNLVRFWRREQGGHGSVSIPSSAVTAAATTTTTTTVAK
jgi:hypothetical protein